MSNYLTNKGQFIISAAATPTSAELSSNRFNPQALKVEFESISGEDSGRYSDGHMYISWLKRKIPKLSIEMAPCNAAAAHSILSLVQGREYYITYQDLVRGAEHTSHVYTSTSSADCYSGIIVSGLYQGISFNAIGIGDDSDDTGV